MDTILSIVIISISVLIVTVLWTMWYQQGSLNFAHASFPSGCTMLELLRLLITTIQQQKKVEQTLILVATTLPIVIFSIFTEC